MSNTQTSEAVKPLTSRERAVLAFERDTAVRDANKLEAIREHFGFTPSYYYAILADLLDPHCQVCLWCPGCQGSQSSRTAPGLQVTP